MDADVKRAETQIQTELNQQILKSYKVQIFSNNKNWKECVVNLTLSNFIIYQEDKLTAHIYKTISRFQYNKPKLYIDFENSTYIIQSHDMTNLFSDISEILQRVLLPSELERIDFSVINAPPIGSGTESIQSRISMLQNDDISSLKKEISKLSKFSLSSFRLSNATNVGFLLPIYLDLIPFIRTLKSIEIPIIGVDSMKVISNFPHEIRYLRKIEINGSVNPILFTFLDRIKKDQNKSDLSSLSFSLSNFNRNDLSNISSIISKGPINSIEFHRAFHQASDSYFYSTFFSNQIDGLLWILNLDRTSGLDLEKLFPVIQNIPFVSLAFCNLDIAETLFLGSQIQFEKLTILNLSGNKFNSIEKLNSIKNIKSLRKLILNNITWNDHSLVQIFKVLLKNFPKEFSLSFCDTTASKDDWNELFDYLETAKYSGLIGLSWCSNPIHVNLFHFLKRNKQLRLIDFDHCFNDNCSELIKEFTSLVRSSTSLCFLSLAGSREKHIGKQVKKVIEALNGHPNLNTFNFPFSYGGDDVISILPRFVESVASLKIINFEGLGIESHGLFLDAMLEISKSQDRLKVSFPTEDVKKLKNVMKKANITKLKDAYRCNYKDPSRLNTKEFSVRYSNEPLLNKNCIYYKYNKKEHFPPFITENTIHRLEMELKSVPDIVRYKNCFAGSPKPKVGNATSDLLLKSEKRSTSQVKSSQMMQNVSNSEESDHSKNVESDPDYDESDNSAEVIPLKKSTSRKTKAKTKKRKVSNKPKKTKKTPPTNREVKSPIIKDKNVDADSNSFASLSSLTLPIQINGNLNNPKNLPFTESSSDEEIYNQKAEKSLNDSEDSLSYSNSINSIEFNMNPTFVERPKYNFFSDNSEKKKRAKKQRKVEKSPRSKNSSKRIESEIFEEEEEDKSDEEIHEYSSPPLNEMNESSHEESENSEKGLQIEINDGIQDSLNIEIIRNKRKFEDESNSSTHQSLLDESDSINPPSLSDGLNSSKPPSLSEVSESSKFSSMSEDSNEMKSKNSEIEFVQKSESVEDDSSKMPACTPHTPSLSIFTKNIFDFVNQQNPQTPHQSVPMKSKEVHYNEKQTKLPRIGNEHDWSFPVHFNMEPDLNEFQKVYEQCSPDVLYDILLNEKSVSSFNSPKVNK